MASGGGREWSDDGKGVQGPPEEEVARIERANIFSLAGSDRAATVDLIEVTKRGTHNGDEGRVLDANWECTGRVKVELIRADGGSGSGGVKSYWPHELKKITNEKEEGGSSNGGSTSNQRQSQPPSGAAPLLEELERKQRERTRLDTEIAELRASLKAIRLGSAGSGSGSTE